MHKIWTIVQREYLSRVKKKSFLITTILIPILTVGFGLLIGFIASKSEEKQTILVNDQSNYFETRLTSKSENYTFLYDKNLPNESNSAFLIRKKADILLQIFPFNQGVPDSIHLYKEGGVSASAKTFIENKLDDLYQLEQMKLAGLDKHQIDSINGSQLQIRSFDLKNNQETSSEVAMMIGYFMGILIYLVILIYGTGVMRGVMEEKTNRIAEVIISSVKPFQLMMGKIVGIALVGLTQLTLWMIIMFVVQLVLLPMIPGLTDVALKQPGLSGAIASSNMNASNPAISNTINLIASQNWPLIIGCFVFYFLGGYFLYASLFAAVGSLVNEDPQEAQQLTIPITMPIILGFVIMTSAMQDPHGNLAVFGSLFPLTSPIVMMARIPYDVPTWQLLLSASLLIIGFVFFTWLSAKIYRTGILMYGKKTNWKDVIKWLKQS